MDDRWLGGGWMMGMKATRGTTFNWGSSYWTSDNVLNEGNFNRNDGDAKFQVMNRFAAKDIMAIWPDIGPTPPRKSEAAGWLCIEVECTTHTKPMRAHERAGLLARGRNGADSIGSTVRTTHLRDIPALQAEGIRGFLGGRS